jgi:hypothetical protein
MDDRVLAFGFLAAFASIATGIALLAATGRDLGVVFFVTGGIGVVLTAVFSVAAGVPQYKKRR